MLQKKIPPPLVTLICVGGVYLSNAFLPASHGPNLRGIVTIGFIVLGLGLLLPSLISFVRARTTVSPLNPERATTLVTTGIFRLSRNPMYLGMACLLVAFTFWLGNFFQLIWLVIFCLYINVFQIKPEEAALTKKFGSSYQAYCSRVRRWV
jgi:protein-S-isoprenylcysteine O-methyltransferase Ste14